MKRKGYFLVFESAPKCGKTTLARCLSEAAPKIFGHTAIRRRGALSISEFSKKVSSRKILDIGYSTAFYWTDAIFDTADFILPNLRNDRFIIQERYDLSIVSYRETHGFYDDFLLLDEYRRRKMIIDSDLTVFLKTNPEIVFQRIISDRESSDTDKSFLGRNHKHLLMQESIINHLKRIGRKFIVVDTGKMNIQESLDFIVQKIKSERFFRNER